MIRPTSSRLPFDFGPLLGPLAPTADPPSSPPPPKNPFGPPNDPVKAQDPKDRVPFDSPIKRNPIKGGLLLPDDPVRPQDPKDRMPLEYRGTLPCFNVKIYYDSPISKEWFGVYMTQTPGEFDYHLAVRAYMRGGDVPNHPGVYQGYFTDYEGDVGYVDWERYPDTDWPSLRKEWDFSKSGETESIIRDNYLSGYNLYWDHIDISFVQNEGYLVPIDNSWHSFRRKPPVTTVVNGTIYEVELLVIAYLDENGCLVIRIKERVVIG
ncbi:MAG: hypothetical protein JNJ94_00050 [Chlorobi bacterium]|nr:hypothetical protein [Chlorobiota bacterium]